MTPAAAPRTIFVSHTAADKEIVEAFGEAVEKLLGDQVKLTYSTSPEHGPRHGDQWLPWIRQQVHDSVFTIVMITPASVRKPWILWEAGAVTGTSIASGNTSSRSVRPVIFRLTPDQVPDPFKDTQFIRGDDYDAMYGVFADWITDLLKEQPAAIFKVTPRLPSVLQDYLKRINVALDSAPLMPTEAVVQEWTLRLDELRRQNRASEVRNLHEWLNIAFGRKQEDIPLDIRIHRRLGELYLSSQDYQAAVVQFELARQLSPRDIFVWRELGRAYIGLKQREKVSDVILAIEKLDPQAFERNAECAALKGRWLRDQDPAAARDVYRKAFQNNATSYYLGDLLGQMQLQLGEKDDARATYGQVLAIINALSEQNLWTQATAANAAIVAGSDSVVVKDKLRQIRTYHPSPEDLRIVEGGLQRVQKALAIDDAIFTEWVAALRY